MGRSNYVVAFFVAMFLCVTMLPPALAEEPPPAETPAAPAEETPAPPAEDAGDPEPSEVPDTPADDADEPDEGDIRTPPNPVERIDVVRTLVFPIVGPTYYYAGFGACRDNCTREHHGIDIMTWKWKGLAVVAAHDGVVSSVTYDKGNAGCSVRIRSRDRWETRYYHLNNDLPGTDTIGASCPVEGIEVGVKVKAGQVIAYVGDSGNAETTPAHVHFELRTPSGHPVDPYKSLKKAQGVTYEWLPSNFSEATIAITSAYKPNRSGTTIVMTTDEASELTAEEYKTLTLKAPVVAIDPNNPEPAVNEIARLDSHVITIMSDEDVRWLKHQLAALATIVEQIPLPEFEAPIRIFIPDSETLPAIGPHDHDRFATIVAGQIDRIRESWRDEFDAFGAEHQSVVIDSTSWGKRYLGQRSWVSPGRYADRTLLWWSTGDGWIGTESMDDVPPQGFAYITERRATPWTLTYLASLAQLDAMPVWRSR